MLEKAFRAFGADFSGAGAQDDQVVEHDLHAPGPLRHRVGEGVQQVVAGVGVPVVDGLLAAGQHDGLGGVLHHIAQRRGGVGHGVGAVGDHKAVVLAVMVPDGLCHAAPVLRADVGGVQVIKLHRVDPAHSFQLRHKLQQLGRRDGRRQHAAAGGLAGDGAAGGQQQDLFGFGHGLHPFGMGLGRKTARRAVIPPPGGRRYRRDNFYRAALRRVSPSLSSPEKSRCRRRSPR